MAFSTARRIARPLVVALIVLIAARSSSAEGWGVPHLRRPPSLVIWEAAKDFLWSFLGVPQGKSGSSLDPDGRILPPPGAGPVSPSGAISDSGSSLDPDGKH
jgi:hypothetical protein